MRFLIYTFFIAVCLMHPVSATEANVEQRIREGLMNVLPNVEISDISETGITGLYQVIMGTDVVYVTGDGRFALTGELYDLHSRENITDNRKSGVRKEILEQVPESEIIEFAPKEPRHAIFVFTDITCGYCRRLHQDVPVLNENGIAVRYLAYPRAGPKSSGSDQLQAVWCSKDRKQALTDAKLGKETVAESCDNPVARHYQVGNELGVRGTPAIFLEDGRALPGYFPPAEILKALER